MAKFFGGRGDDLLRGGKAMDLIKGYNGNDRIYGGAGNNTIDGGDGHDRIWGGAGNDRVADCDSEYTGGARTISGGPGDDRLCVDSDSARMSGNGGDDTLFDLDCSGDSRLSGGTGNDRLETYFSNVEGTTCSDSGIRDADTVLGGDGRDSAMVNRGDVVSGTETVQRR